ncbi:MAG: hypothetical protein U0X73_10510 [Thermoanaerobaculia bacterium]
MFEFSLSPSGSLALVGTLDLDVAGFHLYRVDLDRLRVVELRPDLEATAQMTREREPVISAADWDPSEEKASFPTFSIRHGASAARPPTTGQLHEERPFQPQSTSWYEATWSADGSGEVSLLESEADRHRPYRLVEWVDPRLRFRQTSRGGFELLDHERSDRTIRSFGGWFLLIDPATAVVSPDGEWIGLTVSTENFGSMGIHAYLVRRNGKVARFLASSVTGTLRFRSLHPEVFGISQQGRSASWVLTRWSYG